MKINPKSSKIVLACALGMLAAFFAPWLEYSDVGMSGYNLGLRHAGAFLSTRL